MMNMNKQKEIPCSKEHLAYLKALKKKKCMIRLMQASILILCIAVWQILADTGVIDTFIASSPKLIWQTCVDLFSSNEIYRHLTTTLLEVIAGFLIGTALGVLFAILLWQSDTVQKIAEPYLVVLNALPKVALGPLIIVWAGAGMQSIMMMTLLISVIVATIAIYSSFKSVDSSLVLMLKTFGANKRQILTKVILPASVQGIIDAAKINVGMSFVGVIMGEFLVSKQGLGYLILYGSQVFNLNLVMAGIIILGLLSAAMYFIVEYFEKKITQRMY